MIEGLEADADVLIGSHLFALKAGGRFLARRALLIR
jgi:hypothetical protein